jgi:hypothetical protein
MDKVTSSFYAEIVSYIICFIIASVMPTLSLRGVGQAIAGSRTLRAKVLLREFYEFIILAHSFIHSFL